MIVQVGKDIELVTFLSRNGRGLPGKSLTVQVFNSATGVKILSETPMVERAPSLYGFLWNTIPSGEIEACVEYKWKNFSVTERFSIITSLGGASSGAQFLGEISSNNAISAVVLDDNLLGIINLNSDINGVIDSNNDISIVINGVINLQGEID